MLFQLFTFSENVIILFAELGVYEVFVLINLYYFFGVTSYFMFNQRNFRQLFQPLSAIIDFERNNSTRVEIARSDKGKRYAYFVLGEKKQLVSVAKSLTIEEEKNKELLVISSCRDKDNKPFWLIHRHNVDNVADTLTKPVVSSALQVDIDDLNAELESLLNM